MGTRCRRSFFWSVWLTMCTVAPAVPDGAIDFESPHVTGTALNGQDGWRYWWLTHSTSPADAQPDDQGLNAVLWCGTDGLTEYHRPSGLSPPCHDGRGHAESQRQRVDSPAGRRIDPGSREMA